MNNIALAQLPVKVGDVDANVAAIVAAAEEAKARGAEILLCPELALIGYPPDDLLQRRGLPAKIAEALQSLKAASQGLHLVVGYPEFADEVLYNSAIVLRDGQMVCNYRKQCLPNYGVFDERRHFVAGQDSVCFEWQGLRYGLSICEDLWQPEPAKQVRDAGAQILLNLNASPFDQHKQAQRREVILQRIAETGLQIAYVNAVGGQDEVVFDGDSQFWSADGCLWEAPLFEPGVYDLQSQSREQGADELAVLYQALCVGVRDYVQRNGFACVYVGLSGGIDSALTLAVAADALGAEKVRAVAMPSRYSAQMSCEDAAAQADALGVAFAEIAIEGPVAAFESALSPLFAETEADTTEENLQARSRGVLLMALANKFRGVVLATGNKSELAVGYCTLYGDMCGGFAPIKDVYKTQVYDLARYRNTLSPVIPERVITRPPTAELRPDQKDEDSLPPYDVLDAMLSAYIEGEASVAQLKEMGFAEEDVDHIVRLVRLSEYKRRQAAPGPKVSACAFGRERRYPITARYPDL